MVELTHILSEPKWEAVCSRYAFNPEFFKWVPDAERSFGWMVEIAELRKWLSGQRVGWVAYADGRDIGFIWGDLEEDTLTINICFQNDVSGKDKLEACAMAEKEARGLGVAEVIGHVCIDNKRSMAFTKYLGYKRRRKLTKTLHGVNTDYYEISKVL